MTSKSWYAIKTNQTIIKYLLEKNFFFWLSQKSGYWDIPLSYYFPDINTYLLGLLEF